SLPLYSPVQFPPAPPVPRPVQAFAWEVIARRCAYQAYELSQRSFWASDARARADAGGTIYSLRVLSEVAWEKTEPISWMEMTTAAGGRLRRVALTSSFVTCSP